MSDHITIGDISPRVQFTANGATSTFAFSFPIFENTDLEVYADDALLSSGFTVSGAGDSSGGSVTFDVGSIPANGVIVTLRRRLSLRRLSDFQESGAFRAKVINDELDFLTASVQQVDNDAQRAIRLTSTDPDASLELPSAGLRAGKVLGFDASGNVQAVNQIGPQGEQGPAGNDGADGVFVEIASQAEAQTGTDNVKGMTPLRTAEAITALASSADNVARNLASAGLDLGATAVAYLMAENDATSITGTVGKLYLSDDFESDNLAVSTNATHDVSGDYYHNPAVGYSADIVPAMTGSATSGFTVTHSSTTSEVSYPGWKLFDDLDAGTSIINGTSGWIQVDFDASYIPTQYTIKPLNGLHLHAWRDWTFEGWNGSGWDVLDTRSGQTWSGFYDHRVFQFSNSTAYSRVRWNIAANNGESISSMTECQIMTAASSAAMTFSPSPATLAVADPETLIGWLVISPQEIITVGTDIAITASIDGGTTDAVGTWNKVGNVGATGLELYRVEFDTSAQTGSSLTYEVTTANGKHIRFNAVVGFIAL